MPGALTMVHCWGGQRVGVGALEKGASPNQVRGQKVGPSRRGEKLAKSRKASFKRERMNLERTVFKR
ncbi:hypothetical protein ABID22_003577 [Pontibacter aydingkolensis]